MKMFISLLTLLVFSRAMAQDEKVQHNSGNDVYNFYFQKAPGPQTVNQGHIQQSPEDSANQISKDESEIDAIADKAKQKPNSEVVTSTENTNPVETSGPNQLITQSQYSDSSRWFSLALGGLSVSTTDDIGHYGAIAQVRFRLFQRLHLSASLGQLELNTQAFENDITIEDTTSSYAQIGIDWDVFTTQLSDSVSLNLLASGGAYQIFDSIVQPESTTVPVVGGGVELRFKNQSLTVVSQIEENMYGVNKILGTWYF